MTTVRLYVGPEFDIPYAVMINMHFVAFVDNNSSWGQIKKNRIDGYQGQNVPVTVINAYVKHLLKD